MTDAMGRHHRRASIVLDVPDGPDIEVEFRIAARPDDFEQCIGMEALEDIAVLFVRSTRQWLEHVRAATDSQQQETENEG